jgi:hypothetical protein
LKCFSTDDDEYADDIDDHDDDDYHDDDDELALCKRSGFKPRCRLASESESWQDIRV